MADERKVFVAQLDATFGNPHKKARPTETRKQKDKDIDDYQKRYGEYDDPATLTEILQDASRKIAAKLDKHHIDYADPDEDYADRLMQVCRDMAHRSISASKSNETSDIPFGVQQISTSVNGFARQFGWQGGDASGGFGDLYITRSERELLGLTRRRAGFINTIPRDARTRKPRRGCS